MYGFVTEALGFGPCAPQSGSGSAGGLFHEAFKPGAQIRGLDSL